MPSQDTQFFVVKILDLDEGATQDWQIPFQSPSKAFSLGVKLAYLPLFSLYLSSSVTTDYSQYQLSTLSSLPGT